MLARFIHGLKAMVFSGRIIKHVIKKIFFFAMRVFSHFPLKKEMHDHISSFNTRLPRLS